ncbi:MAG: uL13 family ribosomal protein [Opitutus sp.]|nr:uL13 family ribosomal protein [Opitutus sp.]
MKTFLAKKETVQPKWYLIDAAGVPLGRLAVKAANIIRGRHKAFLHAQRRHGRLRGGHQCREGRPHR